MSDNGEERTVEVTGVPHGVDEELLSLYFENKRRSGGGPLVSVEKEGDRVLLVFEETEAASRVLSKGCHVLHNAELTVRKPASKDPCRLLLCGVNVNTSMELVELYVENMMVLDVEDYTLYPSPGRDLILIHLHTPFVSDFEKLRDKISKKPLDGSRITIEELKQTDSILVENVPPTISTDLLTLYFENKRGGELEVKEVIMMTESIARVSFVNFDSVEHALKQKSHKLDGLTDAEMTMKPYFVFLQPTESPSSSQFAVEASSDTSADRSRKSPSSLTGTQIDLPTGNRDVYQASHESTLEPLLSQAAQREESEIVMKDLTEDIPVETFSSHISVQDPVKLAVLEISTLTEDIRQAHPGFKVQIRDNDVQVEGPDKLTVEQVKNTVLEFLGSIAQAHLTSELRTAQFLANKEVKQRLLQNLKAEGLPSLYTVTDSVVVVTSLSLTLANRACSFMKSQMSDFSISVDREYECMLYSQEWSEFLQSLRCCSATVSESSGKIDIMTLKGMEDEKQSKIVEFLSTPIEKESVISMEPGMLKYIQIHCHQLLAEMDQVTIFPLDAANACGLRIHGNAGACQMADELLRGVVSSICTRTITFNCPGVARFLADTEATSLLKEMQTKFQVYISLKMLHWKPPETKDIFDGAWSLASHQNFSRLSLDGSAQDSDQTDQNNAKAPDRGLIEEAKMLFSSMDESVDSGPTTLSDPTAMEEEEDLYTAGHERPLSCPDANTASEDTAQASVDTGDVAGAPLVDTDSRPTNFPGMLEEEAQLSVAIQYSMESTKRSVADEDEDLQMALELSRKMECPSDMYNNDSSEMETAVHMSLQDAIKAANTAQVFVFASYSCDLIRVDIALGKKVALRQVEEMVEHKSLKSLSAVHKKFVDAIKRKHAVEIQIQGTTATVTGFRDYVAEAVPDLKLLLKKISGTTSDADILRTVQWVWHDQGSSATTPYAADTIVVIESAWKMRQKKIDILLNNQPHIINLEKMQEYNVASGKSVKISRQSLSSADLSSDVAEEDYSLLASMPEASKVNEDSDEFQDVVKGFYDSIQEYHNKIRIIKVEKLMNRLLFNQYRLKKASISQSASDPEVERTLYHGTSETSVKEICIHGFNRSFCGKNATVYGQGVYFAVNSSLSVQDQYSPPNADGNKYVFVTKVLTGDFTKGSHSMKAAPLKESSEIPLRYHSVTDNPSEPSLFVIFNDTQAYPEYIITCQKIHR
ncbi:protein mono-ADP-ribosyltransferase PARP10 [Aplochiton taeniatus]